MNFAEQILRRKREAMYKPTVGRSADTQSVANGQSPRRQTSATTSAQGRSGADDGVILTRDGRIRQIRNDVNITGSMSEINVELDI